MTKREDPKAYAKAYYARNRDKYVASYMRWLERNPERRAIYHAKRKLSEATGLPFASIPDELAEAKAVQLAVRREVRRQRHEA